MISINIFSIAQLLLIIIFDSARSYPSNFYNSKSFSRSSHIPSYDPYDYYSRSQRYPYGYYPSFSQLYPDEYYYSQDAYPYYYVSPRASQYDFYQSSLPYYYQEVPRSKVNYYYGEPSADEEERLLQEFEREQREKAQPIGHEIRYENDYTPDDESSIDETKAAFLNNLMLQQMYQDSIKDKTSPYAQPSYADYPLDEADTITNFRKWDDLPYDRPVKIEDEEVKELQELPKKQKQRKNRQRKQRKQRIENQSPSKRSQDTIVLTDRKPVVKDVLPTSADAPRRDVRGQMEEVMMRPATPVRHPFADSVIEALSKEEEKKRTPSVYDTIRHMLEMENKYEEKQSETKPEMRPSMKKRIVSSEDSLTRQLTVLKKAQ